jgi:hypothetical protein
MIVGAVALDDRSATEEPDELFKGGPRRCGLGYGELMLDLPAEPAPIVAHYRYRETAFAVDEADDPLLETWPFLLIDRTGRIFTPHLLDPMGRV